jgi:hypothetical protein
MALDHFIGGVRGVGSRTDRALKSAQLWLSGVNLVDWSIQFLLPGWQLEGELVGICSGRLLLCPFYGL